MAPLVESLFVGSFVDIEVSDDWTTAAWNKLIMNAAVGDIGILTRRGSEVFLDSEAQ